MSASDALVRVVGRRYVGGQLALDGSAPPVEVTLAAGPWLEQFRQNSHVVSYLGDVRAIAAIPAGKPSGAWAQAIGLALQQRWREQAFDADVARVGEDKKLTIQFPYPFTRQELLGLFPPSPALGEVLDSPNPRRAKRYWDEAIALLKSQRIISFYHPLWPLPSGRQGWRQAFLTQPLDIRPGAETTEAIAQIITARKKRRPRNKASTG